MLLFNTMQLFRKDHELATRKALSAKIASLEADKRKAIDRVEKTAATVSLQPHMSLVRADLPDTNDKSCFRSTGSLTVNLQCQVKSIPELVQDIEDAAQPLQQLVQKHQPAPAPVPAPIS